MPKDPRSRRKRLIVLLVLGVCVSCPLACVASVYVNQETPQFIVLDIPAPIGTATWNTLATRFERPSDWNRFSEWVGEQVICADATTECDQIDREAVRTYLTSWFTSQGWQSVNPDKEWHQCPNTVALIFAKPGGWYYRPTACVQIFSGQTQSFRITITTINPSMITMWDD
ncbi:MAG: hypothetical protein HY870_00470 [Chloroflexi bacterium]|nr:hypothetical protein [Chloroflexota bacterium]